jgi:hypothetical protein
MFGRRHGLDSAVAIPLCLILPFARLRCGV